MKRFPLKHLTKEIAKMYNKECPTHYAGHPVEDIRIALIELFNTNEPHIIEVYNDNINIIHNDWNITFKDWLQDLAKWLVDDDAANDAAASRVISHIDMLFDVIYQFSEPYPEIH